MALATEAGVSVVRRSDGATVLRREAAKVRRAAIQAEIERVELAKAELRVSSRASLLRVEREVGGKEAAVVRKAKIAEARAALAELERQLS